MMEQSGTIYANTVHMLYAYAAHQHATKLPRDSQSAKQHFQASSATGPKEYSALLGSRKLTLSYPFFTLRNPNIRPSVPHDGGQT